MARMYKPSQNDMHDAARKIDLMCFDIDGTLTDGGIYYRLEKTFKRFYCRDGHGITALKDNGVEVILITGDEGDSNLSRADKLHVKCYQNIKDKEEFIRGFKKDLSLIGFMGDDVIDLPAMDICGFSACPADAHRAVLQKAKYISSHNGGQGAVRDVCDFVLWARGIVI